MNTCLLLILLLFLAGGFRQERFAAARCVQDSAI